MKGLGIQLAVFEMSAVSDLFSCRCDIMSMLMMLQA